MTATPAPRLNGTLRPKSYAASFRAHRRLHVPEFLTKSSARALHELIADADSWIRSVHVSPGQDVDLTMPQLAELTPAERVEVENRLVDSSTDTVKYIFDAVRITPDLMAGRPITTALRAIHDFVNDRPFLGFMKDLTGDDRIAFADAMATRYLPGHFATAHADQLPSQRRLYAYVLNLTPEWTADWGGVLNFIDQDGHVAEGYTPKFNALNVFQVPQTHAVSVVSRLAQGPRLSITGWVHARH